MKSGIIHENLNLRDLIARDLDDMRQNHLEELKVADKEQILDYTKDELMFSLKVYQLSAEHHCFLKFKLKLDSQGSVFHPKTDEELKELRLLLEWFNQVPYRFLIKLLPSEEEKRFLAKVLIFVLVNGYVTVLHTKNL